MVEIGGQDLLFSRGEGSKTDKGSLRKTKMKEITRNDLREVSDIGSKIMLQRLQCD